MRAVFLLGAGLVILLPIVSGCDRGVPPEELGEVVFEIPAVPGADQPFEMPVLGPRLEPTEFGPH